MAVCACNGDCGDEDCDADALVDGSCDAEALDDKLGEALRDAVAESDSACDPL